MNILVVSNIAQKVLFEREIKEQLHTGHWRNTRPLGHWRSWCDADVVVAGQGEPVGRNFDVSRDRYDLTAKKFLERGQTARRMITKVRVMMTFCGPLYDQIIRLFDVDGLWHGLPTELGEHGDRIRLRLNTLLARAGEPAEVLKDIHTLISNQTYSESDLKRDLADLKVIMRTVIEGSV